MSLVKTKQKRAWLRIRLSYSLLLPPLCELLAILLMLRAILYSVLAILTVLCATFISYIRNMTARKSPKLYLRAPVL